MNDSSVVNYSQDFGGDASLLANRAPLEDAKKTESIHHGETVVLAEKSGHDIVINKKSDWTMDMPKI